jgi:hypothetical protein
VQEGGCRLGEPVIFFVNLMVDTIPTMLEVAKMNKERQAAIIRKHGAPFHFAAAMGIRGSTVSGVVQGKQTLDPDTRCNWTVARDVPAQRFFPSEGNGDD